MNEKILDLEKELDDFDDGTKQSEVLDEYIQNQQEKINNLTQHVMVLETKIKVLENEKNVLAEKMKIVEDINSEYRKTYRRSPFK
tara:strand:- start:1212 stop:1466 length:255 start_codon:yes stop_codon:yes gene_type:complete